MSGNASMTGKHMRAGGEVSRWRNSSIELLRIVAMLMIIGHHYVVHCGGFNNPYPPFGPKLLAYLLIFSLGKIGVFLFFGISAWFLCMETDYSVKKSLKRVWMLEREVLFYSIILTVTMKLWKPDLIAPDRYLNAMFPIGTSLWWYVTGYALFLLIYPFFTLGLRTMGRNMHAALCLIFFILWGVIAGLSRNVIYGTEAEGILDFVFLYTLITFYRWYLNDCTFKRAWLSIITGFAILAGSITAMQIAGTMRHNDELRLHSLYLASSSIKLPVMMAGFGILILVTKLDFHSNIINQIAKTTFGIYLITDFYAVRNVIWNNRFSLLNTYDKTFAIARSIAYILAVFIVAMLVDLARQGLFAITVDRHRGAWFNKIANATTSSRWFRSIWNRLAPTRHDAPRCIQGRPLQSDADPDASSVE
ncbi:acyltransferase family protein [Bifidobacterium pseudolongum]|uniref:Acyltransferase family n=1 Tax=Bifidobacterium pseudolongum subsp. globosum TaxID=1690 RepID=A0A4Q5A5A2_9BIFI|nr:acyltransferase [Bifidobacterium pseudolongum]RYQ16777.1 Acyltransferase family [Bifidobacterium pseudolongum subsp. globosum]